MEYKNPTEAISYYPIGYVENEYEIPISPDKLRGEKSRIILNPDLVEGLVGLEPGMQLLVVFDFHLSEGFDLLQHPRGDTSRPRRGVFTLRSPNRPNSIGVTIVNLVSVKKNILYVKGLDAINGSPVLDIKSV